MVDLESVLIPHPKVVGRIVENEAVLVLPEKGEVKVLNEVGSRVWDLVNGERTIGEIAKLICQEFEVDQITAEKDILEFANAIIDKGIVDFIN